MKAKIADQCKNKKEKIKPTMEPQNSGLL